MRGVLWFLQACAIVTLGVAGGLKLMDLPSFKAALSGWTLLPDGSRGTIALAVPAMEVAVAGMYPLWPRRAAIVGFCLLTAFTGVYACHLAWAEPPDCGCFSMVLRFREVVAEWPLVIGRNVALMLALLAPLVITSKPPTVPTEARAPENRRGFTLIETLVLIAIVALLVALFLPSIGSFRKRAARVATTASLRSHAVTFAGYSADWRDHMPAITDPLATRSIVRVDGDVFSLSYFAPMWSWHLALARPVYHSPFTSPMFQERGAMASAVTSFWYSPAFLADPAFWRRESRLATRDQFRATKISEVAFADRKAVLLASKLWGEGPELRIWDRMAPLCFTDGSAFEVPGPNVRRGYPQGLGQWAGGSFGYDSPGMMTIDGVLGRDRD